MKRPIFYFLFLFFYYYYSFKKKNTPPFNYTKPNAKCFINSITQHVALHYSWMHNYFIICLLSLFFNVCFSKHAWQCCLGWAMMVELLIVSDGACWWQLGGTTCCLRWSGRIYMTMADAMVERRERQRQRLVEWRVGRFIIRRWRGILAICR
jgi:hypothetical protein